MQVIHSKCKCNCHDNNNYLKIISDEERIPGPQTFAEICDEHLEKEMIQMSYNNKKNSNTGLPKILEFTVTENIEKLEIKKFVLQGKDFLITWLDERHSCIDFKSSSLSRRLLQK